MSEPETGFDGCACAKGEGCWGQDGWHFYRMSTKDYVRLYVKRELSRLAPAARTEAVRKNLRVSAEIQAPTYAGAMTAYEPCPAFQRAVQARVAAGKGSAQKDWSDEE